MTFQFSIWDKFRDLENLPATNFANLVHLVAHLLKTKSLPLSLLKVCEVYGITQGTESGSIQLSLEPRGVGRRPQVQPQSSSDFTVTSAFWFACQEPPCLGACGPAGHFRGRSPRVSGRVVQW